MNGSFSAHSVIIPYMKVIHRNLEVGQFELRMSIQQDERISRKGAKKRCEEKCSR